MARFAFLTGCLDTTDIFSREMGRYLRNVGHDVFTVNVNYLSKDMKRLLREHEKDPIVAVVAFNNLGYSPEEPGEENFWEKHNIEYIDILMDHPFHFHSKLLCLPGNTRLYCVDYNHVDYVRRYYPNIERVGFLPHGGCFYAAKEAADSPDRDIDILYPGSLSRTLVENLIPDFDSFTDFDGADFSGEALSFLINNPDTTTEDCIRNLLKSKGICYPPNVEREVISAFRFLDGFAVSYFREISVRILVENGFKVTVLGDGWNLCDWTDNENLTLLGRVGSNEVLSFMKRSKIVLNTMTWFKKGVHDRIFNGALCGAGVLTDTSGYIEEKMPDMGGFDCFSLKEVDKLPFMADRLLRDEEYRKKLTDSAYETVSKEHTWGNRMEMILKDLEIT